MSVVARGVKKESGFGNKNLPGSTLRNSDPMLAYAAPVIHPDPLATEAWWSIDDAQSLPRDLLSIFDLCVRGLLSNNLPRGCVANKATKEAP